MLATWKMNALKCYIILRVLSSVASHPVNMICVPVCSPNITASAEFVNKWLDHNNSLGIHQLRNHKGTTVYRLLEDLGTEVSQ